MSMTSTTATTNVYEALADILEYPSAGYVPGLADRIDAVVSRHPDAAADLEQFLADVTHFPPETIEEIYTRTFDMAPLCVPYVTAYIYGDESYERGDLMSKLRDLYARRGLDAGGELPDHVAVLLRFAGRLNAEELKDLSDYCLKRPLEEMVSRLQDAGSIYAPVLRATSLVLNSELSRGACHD